MPEGDRRLASVAASPRAPRHGELIRDLAEIGADDAALVGGKAYPLAMLLRRGFSIPKGFCITSEAFRLAGGGKAGEIELPAFLRETIVAAWRQSGFTVAAVRSSAAEEDGRDASWAGIFPTELAVEDEDALIAAVERCFRAVHAPEAKLYRSQASRGLRPAMAVLVQEMVDAEAAGMVFTSNPVSGARDEIVINAVHGLGNALAAGSVTGDTIVVGRDGVIKAQSISPKPFRTTRRGEVAVPPEQHELPAVCAHAVAELAKMAVEIEELFGCPQDIEFAIADRRINILQARPITGLRSEADEVKAFAERERRRLQQRIAQLRRKKKLAGSDVVFSNGNIGELLPTPTPMSFGLFREIFAGEGGAIVAGRRALGYELRDDSTEGLYELICGQPYFNLEVDAGTFNIGVPMDVDEMIRRVSEDPARANYPEFGLYSQSFEIQSTGLPSSGSPSSETAQEAAHEAGQAQIPAGRSGEMARRFHASMVAAGRSVRERFAGEIEPGLRRAVDAARHDLAAGSSVPELAEAIGRRIERLKRGSCVPFVIAARLGFYFAEMVRWRLALHLGDAGLTPQLLQGLEGSRITEQSLDLERLGAGELSRDAFLESYGHWAANELEISLPRLAEAPSALDCLLSDLAASGRRTREDFQHQQRRRREAEAELQERLARAQATAEDAAQLDVDLRLAQAFLPLRETVKYYYAAEYAVIRSLLLRLNRALDWQPNDVFYLFPEEIAQCAALTGNATGTAAGNAAGKLNRRIRERRREHRLAGRAARQLRLPAVLFGSRLHEIGARQDLSPDGSGEVSNELSSEDRLVGTPVAGGSATGVVRLLDCADGVSALKDLRGDEIIVSRSANLGLAPLMRMAAGLIVEVGGVLAHAACQARESGIPAVVLPNATLLLRDGMRVRLDGDSGIVERLQPRKSSCAAPGSPDAGGAA